MVQNEDSMVDFEAKLKFHAQHLIDSLEQGRFGEAVETIQRINQTRDQGLYLEVGRLTRQLHSAIVKLEMDACEEHGDTSQITDATDRLSYVVDMTEKAANRTMDLVEECGPLVNYLSYEAQSLSDDWQKFMHREMTAEQFRDLTKRIDIFLGRSLENSNKLSDNLSNILLAQDFQDLTGQVIKRVTQLISEVEGSLLELVLMASKVNQFAGIQHDHDELRAEHLNNNAKDPSKGEGPQMRADTREDVVSGQDDVDDLLSSLGF